MSPFFISLTFLLCISCSFTLSMAIRRKIPDSHFTEDSKFVIELSIGLIAAMAALVLGLLTASTNGTFSDYDSGVKSIAANLFEIDNVLMHYGEETTPIRETLRNAMRQSKETIWHSRDERAMIQKLSHTKPAADVVESLIQKLNPDTEARKGYIERVRGLLQDITKIRWHTLAGSNGSVPTTFLIVLAFWLSVLFASFGLFAPQNPTMCVLLFLSALSVAGAVFVVLELGDPLNGLIKVSSQPIDDFIASPMTVSDSTPPPTP